MDKNAIKKYAVWARRELISRVSQKAAFYGITDTDHGTVGAESVDGRVLTAAEKKQRDALIHQIQKDGYEQTIEEVAYTWFNRFSALRYMEVNGYLPTHVRVFTDDTGALKPQILTEAINLELDGLDMQKVYDLKNSNQDEALYRYLLITQCNALNAILPGMFQKIEDYTELLLPDNLLREGSVIEQMVTTIPEEDWTDQVQIIGWMYQYYNAEKKDDVFAALKKNVKITKENIPAATQLFTPDWIVRYMVENSLGRIFVDKRKNEGVYADGRGLDEMTLEESEAKRIANEKDIAEQMGWKYYLPEAEQTQEVRKQLDEIQAEYGNLDVTEIKVIDPCMGSGHILVYMFDVLVKIYEAYGYSARDAVKSIVENNLYGLDIDDRAAQLAYFAVMMKARQYDRRFFSRGLQPHVYAIVESNHIDKFAVEYFCNGDEKLTAAMDTVIRELHDAKEYGSILSVTPQDWPALYARFAEIEEDISISREAALNELLPLVQVAEALAQKYDVVVTNPPYRGIGDVESTLQEFVKEKYPASCSDLSTVFMEKCIQLTVANGYYGMINIPVWMSLASYSKLRNNIISTEHIINMLHLGRGMFGSDYGTTAFVIRNNRINNYRGLYKKFFERQGSVETEEAKEKKFATGTKEYKTDQSLYRSLPNNIIAYWATNSFAEAFNSGININTYATVFEGLKTRDKDRFLRFWFEIASPKWKPYAKGGSFRRWYGNNDYVVNWGDNGDEVRNFKKSSGANFKHYFEPAITYTAMTMSKFTGRYIVNQIFGGGGGITASSKTDYLLGFVNSAPFDYIISAMKSTVNFEVGQIGKIPVLFGNNESDCRITALAQKNVEISKSEWDSYEYSWDFKRHPLIPSAQEKQEQLTSQFAQSRLAKFSLISWHYEQWEQACEERFQQLKANEEELNRIFIDIYGLQDELTPEVEDKDVTVRKADLGRDIRSFISYAVGCMFGRYSLYKDGLIFAGEPYSLEAWVEKMNDQPGTISHEELVRAYHNEGVIVNEMFFPDTDNIIPICDDEYFDDDIVGRFVEFVKTVYGEDTLDENLKFIADALGGKGAPKDIIRNYFLNDFYADHCKIYQKRPIYWLFDSGKKNGFKALIYMHRYQPDTIARIRTDYVHEQQGRYRTAIADLESRIANADTGSRVKLTKQLTKLQNQAEELRVYEEKIHHLADQMIRIDLDDGVKHNYEIFKDVLAKIK